MRILPDSHWLAAPRRGQAGYTLTELVIVVAILSIAAAVAVPSLRSGPDKQLGLAAGQFASAIRFARSESIRTGQPHGFRFLTNQYRIRVFSADTAASPWTWIFDVYHPVDKQLYDYTFPPELSTEDPPVAHTPVFKGTCIRPGTIYFDAQGVPWCLEPETVLVDSYELLLTDGVSETTVRLDGISGRVRAQ